MGLTRKQKNVYDYICEYWEREGFAPTQLEIKEFFNFKSLGSVQDYIKYLANAGYLKNDPGAVRGLEPLISHNTPSSDYGVPLLGKVAAGIPIEAIENPEQVIVPDFMLSQGEHFALTVQGDSMIEDGINDGDIVVIKKNLSPANGNTVVAVIDNEATIKKFYKKGKIIELHPANSAMEPIIVPASEVQVKGVLAGLLRKY